MERWKPALLDEEVEDRAVFYEAMRGELGGMSDADVVGNLQVGVRDAIREYRTDGE